MNGGRRCEQGKVVGAEHNVRQRLGLLARNLETRCDAHIWWRIVGGINNCRPCYIRLSEQHRGNLPARFINDWQVARPLLFLTHRIYPRSFMRSHRRSARVSHHAISSA